MSSKRIYYFDLLNILATISVVYLHCNGIVHTYSPGKSWAASLVIEVIFYWAVPVFFMLTGAKTLNYRLKKTTAEFLKGRMLRIFFPYIAWSVILFIVRFSGVFFPVDPNVPFSISMFINLFMTNSIEPTYWFFFAMFGITLSIPVLSLLINNKKVLRYMFWCSFLLNSVLPFLFHFLNIPWNADINIPVSSGYIMYVILGWVISDRNFTLTNRQLKILYFLATICLAIRYGYTFSASNAAGQVDRLFFSYTAFTAVIPSAAVFIWFKNNERLWGSIKHQNLIIKISNASFGVYLIHKLILDNIVSGLLGASMSSVEMRTLYPIIIYSACVLIVLALKKIPLIKAIVP